jgi:hypothetical protein
MGIPAVNIGTTTVDAYATIGRPFASLDGGRRLGNYEKAAPITTTVTLSEPPAWRAAETSD